MTITTTVQKTITESVEVTLPLFKKCIQSRSYFAMLEEGMYYKVFKLDNYISILRADHKPDNSYFDFDDITEEEFMEAWEAGLKSMSFMPTLTIKNIEACPKF